MAVLSYRPCLAVLLLLLGGPWAHSFALVPSSLRSLTSSSVEHSALLAARANTENPPILNHIESHADWLELFWFDDDDEGDTKKPIITAVSFHASWCRYCLKFQRKWKQKIVGSSKLADAGIRFVSVEYGANRKLCQSLNIEQLPTVQLYYGEDLLASFPCPPKELKSLHSMLKDIVKMEDGDLQKAVQDFQKKQPQGQAVTRLSEPKEIIDDEEEEEEDDEKEPVLFQRKRDRLRRKLKRQG